MPKDIRLQLREEAKRYTSSVSDIDHCKTIARISDAVSQKCGQLLHGGRLRYGTTQKAFNLYLKFLWRLGQVSMPPHCPIDGVVLRKAGNRHARWTRSDSEGEYREWIKACSDKTQGRSLADWEYTIWLEDQMNRVEKVPRSERIEKERPTQAGDRGVIVETFVILCAQPKLKGEELFNAVVAKVGRVRANGKATSRSTTDVVQRDFMRYMPLLKEAKLLNEAGIKAADDVARSIAPLEPSNEQGMKEDH